MGFDWKLWDTDTNDYFDMGSGIWWRGLLDHPDGVEALTDPEYLAEWIYEDCEHIREDPRYED